MGRLRKADAEAEALILSKPPEPSRDWGPVVERVFADPHRRAVVMAELASLDEMERSYRRYVLRGNAGAGRTMLEIKKARERLLQLAVPDKDAGDDGMVDVVDWVPHLPEEAGAEELNAELAAAVGDGGDDAS